MIRFRVCDSFTLSFIRTWFELIDDYQIFTKTRFFPSIAIIPRIHEVPLSGVFFASPNTAAVGAEIDSITVQRGSATSQGSCASDRIGAICRKVLQLRHRGRVDVREFRRDGDAFL